MKERLAVVFLILLRVAIGWHFFFEGYEKYHSVSVGPTETPTEPNRPWTSEGYFREAQGPMAVAMRWKLGDPDDRALARLTVRGQPGDEPAKRLPAELQREWDGYFNRFAAHYNLDADQQAKAQTILQQEKERLGAWFTARPYSPEWLLAGLWSDFDRKPFKHTARVGPADKFDANESVAERVEGYRAKLNEYRELLHAKPETLGRDVEKTRRAVVRADLMALRTELTSMLDGRTAEMKSALASTLNDEQKKLNPVPEPQQGWKALEIIDPPGGWTFIGVVDRLTRWGLLLIGAGLMLGLFSRTSALAGALFLVMTVLTTPALPWLPEPPTTEGHYVYISKNVIEMLALFMLTCIPSGRWFGLDALIHALNPWRKKETTN